MVCVMQTPSPAAAPAEYTQCGRCFVLSQAFPAPPMCRCGPTCAFGYLPHSARSSAFTFWFLKSILEKQMPIIAWLLGVPVTVIILLMLFGVF